MIITTTADIADIPNINNKANIFIIVKCLKGYYIDTYFILLPRKACENSDAAMYYLTKPGTETIKPSFLTQSG